MVMVLSITMKGTTPLMGMSMVTILLPMDMLLPSTVTMRFLKAMVITLRS